MTFERIFATALKLAERESTPEVLAIDMDCVVAQTSRSARELGDIVSGVRGQEKHAHHPVRELTDSVIDGIVEILKIRKEIEEVGK
ncbi:MAG: hypothetical protein AAB909_00335 [Patescibacteria group bacterium]